ncbi:MAG: hypothetical protein Q8N36_01065, partial [bacterium]|nr:hypothetical protein [bacterium]
MLRGLQLFQQHFLDLTDHYILIGGTACTLLMEDVGLQFRATQDLDVVLCIEALHMDFVMRFWEFIKQGGYEIKQKANGKKCFYRFSRPVDARYPVMIELFSRRPDILENGVSERITAISVEEQVVSLSAILLDDDYYAFILDERVTISGLQVVSAACVITLKARA